ncbi:hypothetical protein [Pacificoceanicola onchidii]|uniref:hypothetical protein n=1 Tax=Pacificoceanicola onchidii TaxID=2562685 RepID=UPI0010A68A1E|nr:hypothetical protein [Pacificoceanicola onchidii]
MNEALTFITENWASVLGYGALIALGPFSWRFGTALVTGFWRGFTDGKLVEKGRAAFDLPSRDIPPDSEASLSIDALLDEAWQTEDWVRLGKLLREIESAPFDVGYGIKAHDYAADHLIEPLLDVGADLPAEPHGDDFAGLEAEVDKIRHIAITNPHVPMLTVLLCHTLTRAAWIAHGQFYGRVQTYDGMGLFHKWSAEAEGLIRDTGRDPAQSPLLAQAWYHCALALDHEEAGAALRDRWESVLRADPENLALWEEHAHHMLPGWYGSEAEVGAVADRAVQITEEAYGGTIYARIMIAVWPCIELTDVPGYSGARFDRALEDDIRYAGGQPQANLYAAWFWHNGPRSDTVRIFREHLEEVYLEMWPEGEPREALYAAFAKAFGGKPSGRGGESLEAGVVQTA